MSEIRYVQRDPQTGDITGHFSHRHDYATEELPEGHPELLAYAAKREAYKQQISPVKAMEARIAKLEALLAGAK